MFLIVSNSLLKLIFYFFIILYVVLASLLFSLITYTHDKKIILFFCISLFENLILMIPKNKEKRFLICALLLNIYFGLVFFFVGGKAFFLSLSLDRKLGYILFSFGKILISGNWILPIIYNLYMVIYSTKVE